ncbi:MAG: cytochrome-c peroxidase [Chromatiaceae bacterium]|nr:cytochrome-c peroxidase [Chromatiaceae bacterium]
MNKTLVGLVGVTAFAALILAGGKTPAPPEPSLAPAPEPLAVEAASSDEPVVPVEVSAEARLREKALAAGLSSLPSTLIEPRDNAITPDKIELGRMLFFDPRLSASGVISCNTCHNVGTGGDDNLPTSIGHGWQTGPRNSPTVFNAGLNIAQFWDGRAEDLKAQAKGPIQAGVEMANTPMQAVATVKSMPEYVERFTQVFPEEQDPVNFDTIAKAIEAFEATLVTPNAPFDRFLAGEDAALDETQQAGLELFIGRGCTACHSGPNIGGRSYFPFGLINRPNAEVLPPEDKGRFEVTHNPADEYVFRVAPLRNVALTAPYFHSGRVWDLKEAVQVMGHAQLGLALSDEEAGKIVSFLESLTGEMPSIAYPELPAETAATPRPTL